MKISSIPKVGISFFLIYQTMLKIARYPLDNAPNPPPHNVITLFATVKLCVCVWGVGVGGGGGGVAPATTKRDGGCSGGK